MGFLKKKTMISIHIKHAWDANLRKADNGLEYKNFRGTEWQNINDEKEFKRVKNLKVKNWVR